MGLLPSGAQLWTRTLPSDPGGAAGLHLGALDLARKGGQAVAASPFYLWELSPPRKSKGSLTEPWPGGSVA